MSDLVDRILNPDDSDFPVQVRAMTRPPPKLYVRGALPTDVGVAVVGTRAATDEAMRWARGLAGELARAGVTIWSGGALGIDGAAHAGAIEAGGRTVVVMGTGFGLVYPVCHGELFERVLECGGAWLSPFDPGQRGARWTFLQRNELMASMVAAVVLVQAPVRSGGRSTAAAARRMGKDVWAVPGAPWDALSAGCLAELRMGARVCDGAGQILTALGRAPGRRKGAGEAGTGSAGPDTTRVEPAELGPVDRAVFEAVVRGRAHPDEICERTGLPAGLVLGALLTLTLRHVLVEGSDGRFQLVSC